MKYKSFAIKKVHLFFYFYLYAIVICITSTYIKIPEGNVIFFLYTGACIINKLRRKKLFKKVFCFFFTFTQIVTISDAFFSFLGIWVSIWCHFALKAWRSSFSVSRSTDLVATNSHSFLLSENVCFALFLKNYFCCLCNTVFSLFNSLRMFQSLLALN